MDIGYRAEKAGLRLGLVGQIYMNRMDSILHPHLKDINVWFRLLFLQEILLDLVFLKAHSIHFTSSKTMPKIFCPSN